MNAAPILSPAELRRYADAIVKASLGIGKGETLVVTGEPAHRELIVAVAEAGYRAGARISDVWYADPLVIRARLLHAARSSKNPSSAPPNPRSATSPRACGPSAPSAST